MILAISITMISNSYAQNPLTTSGNYIFKFCVSDNGSVIASEYINSDEKSMEIFAKKGQETFTIGDKLAVDGSSLLYNNAIYADNEHVIYRNENTIYKYEMKSKSDKKLFDIEDSESLNLELAIMSPSTELLYLVSGSDITIYNTKNGKIIASANIAGDMIPISAYASENNCIIINTKSLDKKEVSIYKVTKNGEVVNLKDKLASISERGAYTTLPTRDKNIWVFATKEGVFTSDLSTGTISELVTIKDGTDHVIELRIANRANKIYYKLLSNLNKIENVDL